MGRKTTVCDCVICSLCLTEKSQLPDTRGHLSPSSGRHGGQLLFSLLILWTFNCLLAFCFSLL